MQEPSKSNAETRRNDWATPETLFRLIEAEFGPFSLDAAASPENAKCPIFYTEVEDGLTQPWHGNTWVNPPFQDVGAWVKKGYMEASLGRGPVTMLIGARPDTQYWWDYCRHGQVVFLKGRITFVGAKQGADFPSAVVHFPQNLWKSPSTSYWNLSVEQRR
jgi:site-specific DNA-methyltransferase (adenine-specific)